jgi:hypothetical protein
MPGAAKTRSSEMNSLDRKEIEIKYRSRPVKGRYNVSDNFVRSQRGAAPKQRSLGILPAERLAQMLLRH